MVDSNVVLFGQTLAYTLYCIAILLLMGWFGMRITTKTGNNGVKPALFYSFVGFLVVTRGFAAYHYLQYYSLVPG